MWARSEWPLHSYVEPVHLYGPKEPMCPRYPYTRKFRHPDVQEPVVGTKQHRFCGISEPTGENRDLKLNRPELAGTVSQKYTSRTRGLA